MTRGSSKTWLYFALALAWFYVLLWPLMDINADGTLGFEKSFGVWLKVSIAATIAFALYRMSKAGWLDFILKPLAGLRDGVGVVYAKAPKWTLLIPLAAFALSYPLFTERYAQDVAVNVLVYVCLGLGLNLVVGLCGLLDLC